MKYLLATETRPSFLKSNCGDLGGVAVVPALLPSLGKPSKICVLTRRTPSGVLGGVLRKPTLSAVMLRPYSNAERCAPTMDRPLLLVAAVLAVGCSNLRF